MATREWSFEEVDKHVQQADLKQFEAGGRHHTLGAGAAGIPQICAIYAIVKPILQFISKVLPKKWSDALAKLMQLLDLLCPGS
jgi:hypothetical protein